MFASYGAMALLIVTLLLIGAFVVLPIGKPERALKTLRAAAWLIAGVIALATLGTVLTTLLEDRLTVSDINIHPFWPMQPKEFFIDTPATLVEGSLTSVSLVIEGLSLSTRLMLAGGAVLEAGTTVTLLALIGLGCHKILSGDTFAPVVARLARAAGIVVLVAGTLGSLLSQIGRHAAGNAALAAEGAGWTDPSPDWELSKFWPQPAFNLTIEFMPLLLGGALLALALLLRRGTELQQETAGLV